MAFQARDVMKRASTILQDMDAVRWPAIELHGYLNDGLREIVTLKPSANTKTVNLSLVEGTKQTLPAQYTVLSRVVRNMASPTAGASAIRPVARRDILDSQIPGWQDSTVMPFAKNVVHVIHDLADPRTFYVVPGNNGTGLIEAVVGAMPAVNAPPANTADQLLLDSYTNTVDIPDVYQNALIDYVLYRSYSKDNRVAGAAQRAVAHFELFRNAVGGFAQAEAAISLSAYVNPPTAG